MSDNQRGMMHLIPIVLLVLGVVVFASYQVYRNSKSPTSGESGTVKSALSITSDPIGVQMGSDSLCDSAKLRKSTPYTCAVADKSLETTLTAPAQVTKDGKAYVFSTWDGCSTGNVDKKICKVTINKGQTKNLKATYVLDSGATAGTTPSSTGISSPDQPSSSGRPAPAPAPSPSPPVDNTPDVTMVVAAKNQCQNSTQIDYVKNIVTCSVAIINEESLVLSLEWANNVSAKEPPMTATCTRPDDTKNCSLYKGGQYSDSALPYNMPTVVNGDQSMGSYSAKHNIVIQSTRDYNSIASHATTVKFSFPYKYSSNGKDYQFTGFMESNNVPSHAPTYYLDWKYQAGN